MFAATRPIGLGKPMLIDFSLCCRVALAGARQGLGVHVADLVEVITERLADANDIGGMYIGFAEEEIGVAAPLLPLLRLRPQRALNIRLSK